MDKLLSIESSSDWPASLHANTALTLHSQHMCESALRIADLTHSNTQNLPWLLRLSQITQSEQVSIGMCYYQVEGVKIVKRTTRSFSCFAELYQAYYILYRLLYHAYYSTLTTFVLILESLAISFLSSYLMQLM